MFQPVNLAIDKDNKFYITDFGDNTIKIFSNLNDLTTPSSVITGFNFNEKTFSFPDILITLKEVPIEDGGTETHNDKLFVSDPFNHVIKVYNIDNTLELIATLGSFGSGDAQFNQPCGLALSADGTELHVVDMMNHRISVWNASTFAHIANYGRLGHGLSNGLYFPIDIICTSVKTMLVVDTGNNRIVKFNNRVEDDTYVIKQLDPYVKHMYNAAGRLQLTTNTFPAMAIETDGTNFYLSDLYTSNIVKFNNAWTTSNVIASYGKEAGKVKFPKGMFHKGGKLYVADTMSGEIEEFTLVV